MRPIILFLALLGFGIGESAAADLPPTRGRYLNEASGSTHPIITVQSVSALQAVCARVTTVKQQCVLAMATDSAARTYVAKNHFTEAELKGARAVVLSVTPEQYNELRKGLPASPSPTVPSTSKPMPSAAAAAPTPKASPAPQPASEPVLIAPLRAALTDAIRKKDVLQNERDAMEKERDNVRGELQAALSRVTGVETDLQTANATIEKLQIEATKLAVSEGTREVWTPLRVGLLLATALVGVALGMVWFFTNRRLTRKIAELENRPASHMASIEAAVAEARAGSVARIEELERETAQLAADKERLATENAKHPETLRTLCDQRNAVEDDMRRIAERALGEKIKWVVPDEEFEDPNLSESDRTIELIRALGVIIGEQNDVAPCRFQYDFQVAPPGSTVNGLKTRPTELGKRLRSDPRFRAELQKQLKDRPLKTLEPAATA